MELEHTMAPVGRIALMAQWALDCQPDRIRKSSTPFLSASSKSQRYWRTASAVPWNQREPVGLWLAANTSTKPFELYPPTLEFCRMIVVVSVTSK